MRILVVDDNEQNLALVEATLGDEGYEVVRATGGEAALIAFAEAPPDAVILDVRMPGMDGITACSRIRALPGGAEVPILFFTALRDVDTFDQAIRAGGDDFLTKPVRPSELVVRLQTALKLKRLSAELREHYELVRHQRDALMRLQLQKERLTSFVVHDLKAPVTTIDLRAQQLLAEAGLPERAHELARDIRSDIRGLVRLLMNLLDISKSEEGQLIPRYTTVDVAALVAEVGESFTPRARACRVALETRVDAGTMEVDEDLIRRVLENLLDNALRHAPKGSTALLSVVTRGSAVEIRVADSGDGVPSAIRETLFDRYVQGSQEGTETRSGRGLGLAFCKLAVEAHGGSIWVENAGPGAVFCIRLPKKPESDAS